MYRGRPLDSTGSMVHQLARPLRVSKRKRLARRGRDEATKRARCARPGGHILIQSPVAVQSDPSWPPRGFRLGLDRWTVAYPDRRAASSALAVQAALNWVALSDVEHTTTKDERHLCPSRPSPCTLSHVCRTTLAAGTPLSRWQEAGPGQPAADPTPDPAS